MGSVVSRKYFVRAPSPAELARLRAAVRQISSGDSAKSSPASLSRRYSLPPDCNSNRSAARFSRTCARSPARLTGRDRPQPPRHARPTWTPARTSHPRTAEKRPHGDAQSLHPPVGLVASTRGNLIRQRLVWLKLLSFDHAAWISRQILSVDGGRSQGQW